MATLLLTLCNMAKSIGYKDAGTTPIILFMIHLLGV